MMGTTNKFLMWILIVLCLIALIAVWASRVTAQTPPISTIHTMPDTVTSLDMTIHFSVASDVSWDTGGGVGIYWTTDALDGWSYAGAGYTSPITWTAPMDDTTYQFSSTVDDNNGNSEGYEFEPEAVSLVCTGCLRPTDCPEPTILGSVSYLAKEGVTSWGVADTPTIEWYWTHPTSGSAVAAYVMELEILKDGETITALIPGLTRMDDDYGYGSTPYPMLGELQRVRVAGVDADDRQGIWSVWSAWTGDDGPPGVTGAPKGHLVME